MTDGIYREFSRDRLHERVAMHIEELTTSGALAPGDRLPSERELATGLGVGRGVVREAIKLLEERGLVRIVQGRGTFVTQASSKAFSDQLGRLLRVGRHSLADIGEVRRILEVEIAGLAALRITPQELDRLRGTIEAMQASSTSEDDFVAADMAFHTTLARASGNEVMPLLIDVMVDSLQELRRLTYRVKGGVERATEWHRRIYEAAAGGDEVAAREAMRGHLQQVLGELTETDLRSSEA